MNFKNLTKYITFASICFLILRYIPKYKLDTIEVLSLSGLICSLLVIMDTMSPCIIIDKSKCVRNTLINKSKTKKQTKTKLS
jgi:hypothetical protein